MQAHLPTLVEEVTAPPYVPELLAAKAAAEHGPAGAVVALHDLVVGCG